MERRQFGALINKVYSKLPIIMLDVGAIPLAWCLAYWLRFNLEPFWHHIAIVQGVSAVVILCLTQIACYYLFKVYRGIWRFSSLNDVARILRAVSCATLIVSSIFYLLGWFPPIPRSVPALYGILLTTLLCAGRFLRRIYWDHGNKILKTSDSKRVLIIGAGQAGESLVRDLKRTQSYVPIGFIDESSHKLGLEVHGVRVLGTLKDLAKIVLEYQIELIFIAIPSAGSVSMRRIVDQCEQCRIPVRTLPGLHALASGQVEVNALRKVNIEDLLGRDQVRLDWKKIAETIHDKRILVTGGGGSIGSELCRQVALLKPARLCILDHNEFNLYCISQELRSQYPYVQIDLALVSVTDIIAIEHLFKQFKPEIVFHAAAYKHVPMLEGQVRVAVQNNVIGTQIVAQASVQNRVAKFILISSDKAVNPTNIMGTTKRVAEIYCQNLNERVSTEFITVRFGNVLGSVGSVVPLFQQQLEHGGPLTITHPEMKRYFMTILEASQLILQAMVNGEGGEIFVLDMGEPVKISYLAEQMIRLAGKEPGKDIKLEYTGLRPGEKLFEELFHDSEQLAQTSHAKLFKAKFRVIDWQELMQTFRMIQVACTEQQEDELLVLLKSLVPEFKSPVMSSGRLIT